MREIGRNQNDGQRYRGFELTATKRYSNRWTMVAGYTFGKTDVECCTNESTNLTSPNSFVNATGKSSIDRAHNFKLTGSYLLPFDVQLGGNLRYISGQPITRVYAVPGLAQQAGGTLTVNAEPRGSDTLSSITTIDARIGKIFRLAKHEFEADLDVYNITNNNSIFTIRTTTGRINLTDFTTGQSVSQTQYGSPVGVLGPRIIRFNVVYRFGQQ
ncbi:MAG: outer membrane beta-barrel protein [Thermoanaerobaculia bacterium]